MNDAGLLKVLRIFQLIHDKDLDCELEGHELMDFPIKKKLIN